VQEILSIRKQHGGVHVTVFSESGLMVPWKPLSLQDWILYNRDNARGKIPESHLEDEIFRKCVLDDSIVRQMDFLNAGVITSVVSHIWDHSGPVNAHSLGNDLNTSRAMLKAEGITALHDLAGLILTAFPYTPEQVYDLNYETFMLRVAQAEEKLLMLKIIPEPVAIQVQDPEAPQQPAPPPRTKLDAKKLYDQQQQQAKLATDQVVQQQVAQAKTIPREKWWKESPILEAQKEHKINFQVDAKKTDSFSLDSHDMNEPPEMQEYLMEMKTQDSRAKMVREAQVIYKDLLEKLAKQKK